MSADKKQVMILDPALIDVQREMVRQDEKWGEQNHPNGTGPMHWDTRSMQTFKEMADRARDECDMAAREGRLTWRHILLEEVFEAMAESDEAKLSGELIQVEGVAAQWRNAIKRRQARRAGSLGGYHSVEQLHEHSAKVMAQVKRMREPQEPPVQADFHMHA